MRWFRVHWTSRARSVTMQLWPAWATMSYRRSHLLQNRRLTRWTYLFRSWKGASYLPDAQRSAAAKNFQIHGERGGESGSCPSRSVSQPVGGQRGLTAPPHVQGIGRLRPRKADGS